MDVDKFFAKDPRIDLAKTASIGLLLVACLYGSFAVGRPSLLIIMCMILTVALTMSAISYSRLVREDARLYLFLDKDGVVVSTPKEPKELAIKDYHQIYGSWVEFYLERHIIRVERMWYGFGITSAGPASKGYTIRYLGMSRWYGLGIRFTHSANGEIVLIRDWNSLENLFEYALRVLDSGDFRGIYNMVSNAFEQRLKKLAKDRTAALKAKQAEEANKKN